jgi:hypothetical protein
MKYSFKFKLILSSLYGVLQVIFNLFFESHNFLSSDSSIPYFYLTIFIVTSLAQLVLLHVFLKEMLKLNAQKILFSLSFLLSALIGGQFIWLIVSYAADSYLVLLSSFVIISLFPMLISVIYFVFKDAEERFQTNGLTIQSYENKEVEPLDKMFKIENNVGKTIFEVPINLILCFESDDNYVTTYFLNDSGELKKSLERIALRKIEEILSQEDVEFFRVHKSYLINNSHVEAIEGKSQAYKIKLKKLNIRVPVSRSFDVTKLTFKT